MSIRFNCDMILIKINIEKLEIVFLMKDASFSNKNRMKKAMKVAMTIIMHEIKKQNIYNNCFIYLYLFEIIIVLVFSKSHLDQPV